MLAIGANTALLRTAALTALVWLRDKGRPPASRASASSARWSRPPVPLPVALLSGLLLTQPMAAAWLRASLGVSARLHVAGEAAAVSVVAAAVWVVMQRSAHGSAAEKAD